MTLTSALLLAVQPSPLVADASRSLNLASDAPAEGVEAVFNTAAKVQPGRWKYIYIHHSRTPVGSAATLAKAGGAEGLADHFVLTNGEGGGNGEIQVGARWNQQQSAGRTAGVERMDSSCLSICLIGDFDRAFPTPAQMQRLNQLVTALQARLRIRQDRVWIIDASNTPAGMGRYFPLAAFREQLLP